MLKPLDQYSRILIRLPNAVGDTVMATPALRRLAMAVGASRIAISGPQSSLDVLAGAPWYGEAIAVDRKGIHKGMRGIMRLAREYAELNAELAILFPNSVRVALAAWLARIPERVGYYKEGRRFFLTAGRKRDRDEQGRFIPKYTGRYFDELLDLFPDLAPVIMHPELFLDAKGEEEFRRWAETSGYTKERPLIVVVPGAAFGPSKIWIPERYAFVASELARAKNAQVLISHGPGEEMIAAQVKHAMTVPVLADANVSLCGLKSIIGRAAFMLTNDTGPRHLAVAFNVPNVTIMGPNDPRYTHLDDERGEVVREPVACSPCQLKVCPLKEQICMTQLRQERVLERCLAQWRGGQ